MGVRGRMPKKEPTEELIIEHLNDFYLSPNSCKYQMSNLYVFAHNWESDYLAITKSGYCYEGEVKISKSDFHADFKKKEKHLILEGKGEENAIRPNYFFYAVPTGLIQPEEVPEYAGLVYVDVNVWGGVNVVKAPPKLHSEKYTVEQLNLTDKFYYNMVSWKQKAKHDFENEINKTRQLLKEAKTDEDGNRYPYTLGEAHKKIKELKDEIKFLEQREKDIDECYRAERRKWHEEKKELGLLK